MDERLAQVVVRRRGAGEPLLFCGIVAGDPFLDATVEHLRTLSEYGADVIDLLFPFSDPAYHGPVVQRACARALREPPDFESVAALGERFRAESEEVPLVLTTYFNPLSTHGRRSAAERLAAAGFDAIQIVDLPFEQRDEVRSEFEALELPVLAAVAPTTSDARLGRILSETSGPLLWTADLDEERSSSETLDRLRAFRARLERVDGERPLVAATGASSGAEAIATTRHADGVLVRSTLVWLIEGGGPDIDERLAEFVSDLREQLDRSG
jgi:tryptophan synthase alpha chain